MLPKAKIIVAALAFAVAGGGFSTDAFAHKRPKHGHPHLVRPAYLPTIEQRLGGLQVDPTITGTWTGLDTAFPGTGPGVPSGDAGPGTALLMTDGSIVMQDICTPNWFRLLPDRKGSYIHGSWSVSTVGDKAALAPMIGSGTAPDGYGPLFFASQILADGRLIVQGGEDEASTNKCGTASPPPGESKKGSLFNPHNNTWSAVPTPQGWSQVGDASSILLGPNNLTGAYSAASYMVADCCDGGAQATQQAVATIAPFPGTTITWTLITGVGKAHPNSEENWTLLSTGQILTVNAQCNGSNAVGQCTALPTTAELFAPSSGKWTSAGNTQVGNAVGSLALQICNTDTTPPVLCFVPEMGAPVSIGFNMVVQIGANSNTGVFTYPSTWTSGPAFPSNQEQADGPSALLPNGNILVMTSNAFSVDKNGNTLSTGAPSLFWEFSTAGMTPANPGVGTLTPVNNPPCNDATKTNVGSFQGRMVLLPSGGQQNDEAVLWNAGEGVNCASVYRTNSGDGSPNRIMRPAPHIATISNTTLTKGNTFTLTGSVFRDQSLGASYGDDAQSSTNFPIVRITNNASGNVCFGRTHDWAILTSTQFDVPPDTTGAGGNTDWALVENSCDTGASTLVVIVNGMISNSIAVTIQ
jgi:hypothetical protein